MGTGTTATRTTLADQLRTVRDLLELDRVREAQNALACAQASSEAKIFKMERRLSSIASHLRLALICDRLMRSPATYLYNTYLYKAQRGLINAIARLVMLRAREG
jgi:predicted transcriptional regulator of viral defense system